MAVPFSHFRTAWTVTPEPSARRLNSLSKEAGSKVEPAPLSADRSLEENLSRSASAGLSLIPYLRIRTVQSYLRRAAPIWPSPAPYGAQASAGAPGNRCWRAERQRIDAGPVSALRIGSCMSDLASPECIASRCLLGVCELRLAFQGLHLDRQLPKFIRRFRMPAVSDRP
jgi:hypothetical protein